MAYGLDFEEIYYTDHERVDIGVLQTYEIDIDLALEKDFKIESPEPIMPIGGFWYIQNTEYGGIIDGFETDSDEEKITYTGRTFRGLLNSHIVDVKGQERIIPTVEAEVDPQGGSTELKVATVKDCMDELLSESGLTDVFTVDEPYIDETVSDTLPTYTVKRGTTLYDALVGIAESIDFTFVLKYQKDKKIHIVPILIQDYVDYLKGSKYDGLSFSTELDTAVVNHLVIDSIEEDEGVIKEIRTAHFFADKNGKIQPYTSVDNPIKDEQYIIDKTNQILFGIDEVTAYEETSNSVVENYEQLEEAPSDWEVNFGNYFYRVVDEETGEVSFEPFEAVGEEVYTVVASQPADWAENYSSYYTRSWDGSGWSYSPVSADTIIDPNNTFQITTPPYDWNTNYGDYSYLFDTGAGYEYRNYEGVEYEYGVQLTSKPSDWDSNFGSYYRKVYKKVTTSGGKKKEQLIDTVDRADAYYVACTATDDGKNKTKPDFFARPHYMLASVSTPPAFNGNNCYLVGTIEVTPQFLPTVNTYYSMEMVYHAPTIQEGNVYQMVLDHYKELGEQAKEFFEDERIKRSQELELDYLAVNIGDIVGGTDEFTGTKIVGTVNNIEAKIENGLLDVFYKVVIDEYTTDLTEE